MQYTSLQFSLFGAIVTRDRYSPIGPEIAPSRKYRAIRELSRFGLVAIFDEQTSTWYGATQNQN